MPVKNSSVTRRKLPGTGPGRIRWDVRWRDSSGRVRTKSFATRREADQFAGRVDRDKERGVDTLDEIRRRDVRVRDVAEDWYRQCVHDGKTPKTLAGYRTMLDVHVLPKWGSYRPVQVATVDVQRWLDKFGAKRGGAVSLRRAVRTVLRQTMQYALAHGLTDSNPVLDVRVSGRPVREKMFFLTPQQIDDLASQFEREVDRVMVKLVSYTGLRAGEAHGLRVSDVNVEDSVLVVAHSLSEVNGVLYYKDTKSHKARRVPVPRTLMKALFDVALEGRAGDEYVWTTPSGRPNRHNNWSSRTWKPAVRKAESVPDGLRFHDLRHTAASLAIAAGAHPLAVKERLGHSSITVTLDRYAHLFPVLDAELADRMDEWL